MPDIQPQYVNLEALLYRRLFRIPQYQRSYSWTTKERQDLFNDIRQSYEADDSKDHFMATIVVLKREAIRISVTNYQKVDIVDGQQRITTLILLLKAVSAAMDGSDEAQDELREDIERHLIKADKASQLLLQTNHDSDDYYDRFIREGVHINTNEARTLAGRQLLMAMDECESFVEDWQNQGNSLIELVGHMFNHLTFIFHEIDDERLVYSVFEVLNSRGLSVSWFDRLKSMLMSIVFEAETGDKVGLIDQVHNLWADLYEIVGLHMGMSTESLRFAATLVNESELSRPLGEAQAAALLHQQAKGGPEYVLEVTNWLKAVTEAVDALHENQRVNAVTRIQQARLLATAINLHPCLSSPERESILKYWENVTFRIYGMFGKDARTAVGNYTRLAWRVANDNMTATEIIGELQDIGEDYPIYKAVSELRSVNCYEGWENELRYFFHRYEEHLAQEAGQKFENEHWNHIWAVSPSNSIEHITPQSSGVGYMHWLGNLVLLPPGLNSKLGDRKPKLKAKAYRDTGMRIAQQAAKDVSNGWSRKKARRREQMLLDWALNEWAD